MSKKSDIKICRYKFCKHSNKEIDIQNEEFSTQGRMYFHKDCLKEKKKADWKDAKTKADLQLIKNLWVEHISKTVSYSKLFMVLNDLIERGIDSDYLVFVMQYCIRHNLNLNYPNGFIYFVDNDRIKIAYSKKTINKLSPHNQAFIAKEEDSSPVFSINQKKTGFQNIIRSKETQ